MPKDTTYLQEDLVTHTKLKESVRQADRDARFLRQARWAAALLLIVFSLQVYAAIFVPLHGVTIWQLTQQLFG
ncbi:MAG: hypothetical protein AAF636_19635 [Pseudomonadota bacterium]